MATSRASSPLEPRGRRRTLFAGASLAILLAVCSDDSRNDPGPPPPNDGASDEYGVLPTEVAGFQVSRGAAPGYVSDQACAECHEELFQSYQAVGMARSFYRLSPKTAVEDFGKTFVQKATGFRYVMSERDGRYFLKRYCEDDYGLPFAEHEAEVAWVVGSGNHARTYLTQTGLGELYELPLSWYRGTGWQMSPGFELAKHDHFERQIPRDCMFCHNAYPEVPVGTDLPESPHLFPQEMPHGIGCQRCHGPGARHVEAAASDQVSNDVVIARIANPARFTPELRAELCMTCHMQPDVTSGGSSISHAFGRPHYSHRPGQSIFDHVVYFDFGSAADREAKIEVNHHGHRMHQSKCYTASGGKLTCLTCHDPHRKVAPTERVRHYREKCMQCHQLTDCQMEGMGTTQDPAAADCVSCHMYEARPRDVVQVTITDHRIRRDPPAADLTAPRPPSPGPIGRLSIVERFPERSPRGALLDVHRGLAKSLRLEKHEAPALVAALDALEYKPADAYLRVGNAVSDAGDHARAIAVLRDGLREHPGHFELLWNLAMVLHKDGEHDQALPLVDSALAIRRMPRALELRGNLLVQKGDLAGARAMFAEALELRPVLADTWRRYGRVLASLDQLEEATRAFENAIARNPDAADAYIRLADVHILRGQPKDALRVWRQGASRAFEVRMHWITQRAVGHASVRDPAAAVELAEQAVARHPLNAEARLALAFAQTFAGREKEAIANTARARTSGADPACCTALAALHECNTKDAPRLPALLNRFEQEKRSPGAEWLRPLITRILDANVQRRRERTGR